jgi:hypothetical protein
VVARIPEDARYRGPTAWAAVSLPLQRKTDPFNVLSCEHSAKPHLLGPEAHHEMVKGARASSPGLPDQRRSHFWWLSSWQDDCDLLHAVAVG